jgi:hypothetical protein
VTRSLRRSAAAALAAAFVLATPAGAQGPWALDADAPVPYFIADGAPDSGFTPADRDLARWALEAWAAATDGALRLREAPEDEALVRVYWAPPSGGQYGQMQPLLVDGRPGAAVFIRPDTSALGPFVGPAAAGDPLLRETIVYLTCLHELGHAVGLGHTDAYDDIMYSFQFGGDLVRYFTRFRDRLATRADIAGASGLSPADRARVRALYPMEGGQ